MTVRQPLSGLRLMVVEDEFLVALQLERLLEGLGATVVASAGTLAEARHATSQPLDGVLLDVRLGSDFTHALADDLLAAGIPFIFTTGFDVNTLPEHLRRHPRLSKPFSPAQLERLAQSVFFLAPASSGGSGG